MWEYESKSTSILVFCSKPRKISKYGIWRCLLSPKYGIYHIVLCRFCLRAISGVKCHITSLEWLRGLRFKFTWYLDSAQNHAQFQKNSKNIYVCVAKLFKKPRFSLRNLFKGQMWDHLTYITTIQIGGGVEINPPEVAT